MYLTHTHGITICGANNSILPCNKNNNALDIIQTNNLINPNDYKAYFHLLEKFEEQT